MPDLNSVPASSPALARRASSQRMPPPPAPVPVPGSPSLNMNVLPSNQGAVNNLATAATAAASSPTLASPRLPPAAPMLNQNDGSGAGTGPGPLRHPRPMTAVEMHAELEKEQEAVVNRLMRELSILRTAHNASVISNASSTSASMSGTEFGDQHGAGFSHPHGDRHHRTSSNASTRSLTANMGSVAATATSISSPAPVRPVQSHTLGGISLSRQNSTTSRRSRAGSPSSSSAPFSMVNHVGSGGHLSSQGHSQNPTPSSSHSYSQNSHLSEYFAQRHPHAIVTNGPVATSIPSVALATPSSGEQMSPGLLPATSRYEETIHYRSELDNVKRENDALKRRVRELERLVRDRRASDASAAGGSSTRVRSESASTMASVSVAASANGTGGGVSIAAQRDNGGGAGGQTRPAAGDRPRVVSMHSVAGSIGVGVPEEEVKVGESAASAGTTGQEG